MEIKQSQTESQVKVKYSRLVNGRMTLEETTIYDSHFDTFKEDLERQGGKVNRWEPITVKAVPLFWKEKNIDGNYHAMQVVDYGGKFLARHYIGKNDPIEIALGLDTVLATTTYNEYLTENNLQEFAIDDLAFYCGHTYGYQAV